MPGGGIDSYTKLLLHMDSSPFVDSGTTGHTITNPGSNVVTAAGYFDDCGFFDNAQSAYLTIPHHNDFDFQDQDWVIEFWYRGTTPGYNFPAIYCRNLSGRSGLLITLQTNNNIYVYIDSAVAGQSWNVGSAKLLGSVESDTFHHYALLRSGNNYYTFKDGVQQVTWSNSSTLVYGSATTGIGLEGTTEYIYGYLDEFRISVGTDRGWSGGFTPPTEAYSVWTPPAITIGNVNLGNLNIN